MKRDRCRHCGLTWRCRLCGVDVEARTYITQGEHAGLCGGCYSRPTIFGWSLGNMMQEGAFMRWLRSRFNRREALEEGNGK